MKEKLQWQKQVIVSQICLAQLVAYQVKVKATAQQQKENSMTQDELDLWSDINNPNNDADMDDWADAHNPNNDDYLDD